MTPLERVRKGGASSATRNRASEGVSQQTLQVCGSFLALEGHRDEASHVALHWSRQTAAREFYSGGLNRVAERKDSFETSLV